jgi:hypothetical protein
VTTYRRIQIRRGLASEWLASNPALQQGELGLDLTAKKLKVGDGFTSWVDLDYIDQAGMDEIRSEYGDEISFEIWFDANK